MEEWRKVPDWPEYEVSNYGQVKRNRPNGVNNLKPWLFHGYPMVALCINGQRKNFFVHTLVARAFLGPKPTGFHVHHKDFNKLNNNIHNIEYILASEHRKMDGHNKPPVRWGNPPTNAKLTYEAARKIRRLAKDGWMTHIIAGAFKVSRSNIQRVLANKHWFLG